MKFNILYTAAQEHFLHPNVQKPVSYIHAFIPMFFLFNCNIFVKPKYFKMYNMGFFVTEQDIPVTESQILW